MQETEQEQMETLCWTCTAPGTGRCVWDESKGITPVEGWTAQRTFMRPLDMSGPPVQSYRVIACPKYQPCNMNGREHYTDYTPRTYARDYSKMA